MEPTENLGRSRARARGRARGQKPPEPARRPTDVVPATSMLQFTSTVLSAGRGATRGRRIAMEEFRTRPDACHDKQGNDGIPINLLTNYVTVESTRGPDFVFYQYRVEFSPTIESSRMRRAMLFDHLDTLGRSFVFDGMEDLKTTNKLAQEVTEVYSSRRTDDVPIRLTIKFTGELNSRHPEVLRLMNTQLRKNFLHMQFQQLGRYFYDKDASNQLPRFKIELWPGFITAIRMHENNLLMVVDSIHKVLRQDTILEQMREIYQRGSSNYQSVCQQELVGSVVMTPYNNRTYSLDDFDFTKNPRDSFETRKAGLTTYIDYYKQQYDINIRDLKQPLIVCRPKERDLRSGARDPVYLLPELCVCTGLTEKMRSDFGLMAELAKTTRPDPQSRVDQTRAFIKRCATNEKVREDLARWGVKYGEDLLKIEGRILKPEKLAFPNELVEIKNGDFNQTMRGRRMYNPKHMERFYIVSVQRDVENANALLDEFRFVCRAMEVAVSNPLMIIVQDSITAFANSVRDAATHGAQLVVIIVPSNSKHRYDAIKKAACIDHPIPSQVVVSRTLSKKHMLRSIATKIAIQITCKLGGAPWRIIIPPKNIMIVGYDTFHDTVNKSKSVGALVSTINQDCTLWSSRSSIHTQGQEMCDHLYVNFVSLLKRYVEVNGNLPDLIVYYRDGVSDGQVQYVQEYEVPQILRAYRGLSNMATEPRLAFIVVNKRISTRFFKLNGGCGNPPPGTVVDSVVTRPERYDFFLVSQSVRQGTVSPTQFNIIRDTSGLKPSHVQRLTYKLCHMYYNWQGTIRVPAPCQYAHKLAFLIGQSLHTTPALELNDKLFFL